MKCTIIVIVTTQSDHTKSDIFYWVRIRPPQNQTLGESQALFFRHRG